MLYKKGFTLIELLIVIAIIGILSSTVIASLNKARDKSKDVKIKAQLTQINTSAEIFFNQSGNYGTETNSCSGVGSLFVDTKIDELISNSETVSGASAVCVSDNGSSGTGNANSWAVSIPLKTDPLTSWCTNNIGESKIGTAQISSHTAVCI